MFLLNYFMNYYWIYWYYFSFFVELILIYHNFIIIYLPFLNFFHYLKFYYSKYHDYFYFLIIYYNLLSRIPSSLVFHLKVNLYTIFFNSIMFNNLIGLYYLIHLYLNKPIHSYYFIFISIHLYLYHHILF